MEKAKARTESANQSFHLGRPRDVLDMLEWQLQEVQGNTGERGAVAAYRFILAANTAWSICDWMFEFLQAYKPNGFPEFKTGRLFREHVRGECPELDLCRLMATAYKHSRVDDMPETQVETLKMDRVAENGGALAYWAIIDKEMNVHEPAAVLNRAHHYWLVFMDKAGAHERSLVGRSLAAKSSVAQVLEEQMKLQGYQHSEVSFIQQVENEGDI